MDNGSDIQEPAKTDNQRVSHGVKKKATSIDDIHNSINIYMHDHQTGMPRNMLGPMLCLTEAVAQDIAKEGGTQSNADIKEIQKSKTEDTQDDKHDRDVYAATKGSKGNGKGSGKSKGHGECWHCREWGHPRRESPQFQGKGSISALKGYTGSGGKGKGKKGKGGKGYGYKGKGKGNKGAGYYNYRYPGKGVGKGLTYMNDDWYNAWGTEDANNYYNDDWYNDYGDQHLGYFGNLIMLLERRKTDTKPKTKIADVDTDKSTRKQTIKTCKTTDKCAVLEHEPFRNTSKGKPITLQNKFHILQNEDDDDDGHDTDNDNDTNAMTITIHHTTRLPTTKRPTKRPQSTSNNQREPEKCKSKMTQIAKNGCGGNDNTITQHGHDAQQANSDKATESSATSIPPWRRGWHPGPEHSGRLKEHRQHVSTCNEPQQQCNMHSGTQPCSNNITCTNG